MRFWQEEGRPKDYELYERLLEDAAGEFCQLFVLPNGVSPLASAWLPGGDPNRAAGLAAVTRALRAEGQLELPDALGVLPDDHVSVVLALGSWMMSDPDVRRDGERSRASADLHPVLADLGPPVGIVLGQRLLGEAVDLAPADPRVPERLAHLGDQHQGVGAGGADADLRVVRLFESVQGFPSLSSRTHRGAKAFHMISLSRA